MKFEELGLHEDILEGIRPMNFDQMTPVQEQTIPVIMEGRDLIGCAQTGTGKTAAYTLPLLERLLREGNPDNVVKSLIVVPRASSRSRSTSSFRDFPTSCRFRLRSCTAAATGSGGASRSRAC